MEMLLMGLCISVFGLAVVALAFRAATGSESPRVAQQQELPAAVAASVPDFIPNIALAATAAHAQIPIDLLLLQIENHVRLERAAAESFIGYPSQALLHSKTTETFVN